MASSKAKYDFDPLADLPPPSYAQATADTSQSTNPNRLRSAEMCENSPRSNGIAPSMEVSGARASMAAAQDVSFSKARVMKPGDRQYSAQSNQISGSPGLGSSSYPDRGGMQGTSLGHIPGGRIIGRVGERFGVTQGPQQVSDRNGPNQRHSSEGMYDRNDYRDNGQFEGPMRGGVSGVRGGGLLGRGGGLLGGNGGLVGGLLGGMGGPRDRRSERRSARREARWERRAF